MKLFQAIDNSFIGRFVEKRIDIIGKTNPDRIYVENIRSFYKMPFPMAKLFCEMAVKEKLFIKKYGIRCRNEDCNRIIQSITNIHELPFSISCINCQSLDKEHFEFTPNEKDLIVYYQLVR